MISKLQSYKKMILIISIILFFIVSFFISIWNGSEKEEIVEPFLEKTVEEETVFLKTVQVDIKGAVKNPGVYELEEGARVKDVIEKSGGFLEGADQNTINLSKKLEDEMVIIIYTSAEIAAFMEEETRSLKTEQTCICPKIENNACVKEAVTNKEANENLVEEGPRLVSLNTGSVSDFESLPGIGNTKANAIVLYREEHGGFTSIEEIKEVSGIGEATFEKIKEYLTL